MGGCLSFFESYRQWKLKKTAQVMNKSTQKQQQQVQIMVRKQIMLTNQIRQWKSRGYRPQARIAAAKLTVVKKQIAIEEKRLLDYNLTEANMETKSRDVEHCKLVKHIEDASKLQTKSMGDPDKLQKQVGQIKTNMSRLAVFRDISQEAVPDLDDMGGAEHESDAVDELDEIIDNIDAVELSATQMRAIMSLPDPDAVREYELEV